MRIVGGRWRGRRLKSPPDISIRPTADRVKEAWISIVLPWLVGARVLDLFAGSGALGLEALSRGAAEIHFVESGAKAIDTLKGNVALLGADDSCRIHRVDVLRYLPALAAGEYDVAFADPPYKSNLAWQVAEYWLSVPFAEILGVEHAIVDAMPAGGDTRRYGDTAITLYRRQ